MTSQAVADQVVSSASNFLLGLSSLVLLGLTDVGVVSVLAAVYGIALAVSRGTSSDLLIAQHAADPATLPVHVRAAAGGAAAVGLVSGAACAVAAALAPASLAGGLLTLAVALPVLLVQDVLRYGCFAAGRPKGALVLDVVWLGTHLLALTVVALPDATSTVSVLAAWEIGAVASVAVGLVALGRERPRGVTPWRDYYGPSRPLWLRYLSEGLLVSGTGQLLVVLTGLLTSLRTAGTLKLLNLAFSPVYLVLLGVGPVVTAEAARRAVGGAAALDAWRRRTQSRLVGFAAVSSLLLALALVLVPSSRDPLDDNGDARVLAGFYALYITSSAISVLPQALLRALARASLSLRTRSVTVALGFGLPVLGLVLAGATGFVLAIAAAGAAGASLWVAASVRALRETGGHEQW